MYVTLNSYKKKEFSTYLKEGIYWKEEYYIKPWPPETFRITCCIAVPM